MDPFEEFEFKPITEGLGFHKKKNEGEKDLVSTEKFHDSTAGTGSAQAVGYGKATSKAAVEPFTAIEASLLRNQGLQLLQEETADPLKWPLPRKQSDNQSVEFRERSKQDHQVVDDILKNLQKQKRIDAEIQDNLKKAPTAKKQISFKPITPHFGAIILDTMLVLAAFLMCMVLVLIITKIDLIRNIAHPDEQYMVYFGMAGLLAAVSFIYLVINRAFMGCTPGEWAYDQQLGTPKDYLAWKYIPSVMARSLLTIASAYVLLPVVSYFLGEDIAGIVTGSLLYEKH